MRLKVSEIVSSLDFYTRTGEFKDEDTLTLDIITDCDTDGMTYIEDESMIQVLEMLGHDGEGLINLTHTKPTDTKYEREYVMTFEEYVRNNPNVHSNFQKFPPQDPDYDNRPKGWRDDDLDDDEEE